MKNKNEKLEFSDSLKFYINNIDKFEMINNEFDTLIDTRSVLYIWRTGIAERFKEKISCYKWSLKKLRIDNISNKDNI